MDAYLLVRETLVRLRRERHHFPQHHAVAPHVGIAAEHAVFQALRSHPPDRQQALATLSIIVPLVDVSGHPEVSHFHRQILRDHAVPGSQVSVNELLGGEIGHSVRDLDRHVKYPVQLWRHVGHALASVRPVASQVPLQVPVHHQLHDYQRGLTASHHAEQLDHVVSVETPARRSYIERRSIPARPTDSYFITDASLRNSIRSRSVASLFTVFTAHRTSGLPFTMSLAIPS